MDPISDNIINISTAPKDLGRTRWLLKCTNAIIGDERERIALLETQIKVLERTPAGGFFTPDIHCVPGKWSSLSWKDSNGIEHRVEDASFSKCLLKHLESQPKKILGLVAVIAVGVASASILGEVYQRAESNGTLDAIEKTAQQGLYRVLEQALEIRDKHF